MEKQTINIDGNLTLVDVNDISDLFPERISDKVQEKEKDLAQLKSISSTLLSSIINEKFNVSNTDNTSQLTNTTDNNTQLLSLLTSIQTLLSNSINDNTNYYKESIDLLKSLKPVDKDTNNNLTEKNKSSDNDDITQAFSIIKDTLPVIKDWFTYSAPVLKEDQLLYLDEMTELQKKSNTYLKSIDKTLKNTESKNTSSNTDNGISSNSTSNPTPKPESGSSGLALALTPQVILSTLKFIGKAALVGAAVGIAATIGYEAGTWIKENIYEPNAGEIQDVYDSMRQTTSDAIETTINTVSDTFTSISETYDKGKNNLVKGYDETVNQLSTVFEKTANTYNSVIDGVSNGITTVAKIYDTTTNGLSTGITAVSNTFKEGSNNLVNGFNASVLSVSDWFTKISNITNPISSNNNTDTKKDTTALSNTNTIKMADYFSRNYYTESPLDPMNVTIPFGLPTVQSYPSTIPYPIKQNVNLSNQSIIPEQIKVTNPSTISDQTKVQVKPVNKPVPVNTIQWSDPAKQLKAVSPSTISDQTKVQVKPANKPVPVNTIQWSDPAKQLKAVSPSTISDQTKVQVKPVNQSVPVNTTQWSDPNKQQIRSSIPVNTIQWSDPNKQQIRSSIPVNTIQWSDPTKRLKSSSPSIIPDSTKPQLKSSSSFTLPDSTKSHITFKQTDQKTVFDNNSYNNKSVFSTANNKQSIEDIVIGNNSNKVGSPLAFNNNTVSPLSTFNSPRTNFNELQNQIYKNQQYAHVSSQPIVVPIPPPEVVVNTPPSQNKMFVNPSIDPSSLGFFMSNNSSAFA